MSWNVLFAATLTTTVAADRDLLSNSDVSWRTVHDTVMGGRSSGSWVPVEDGVRFEGTLSLQNNGGFASLRARSDSFDLANTDGIELEIIGDGRVWWVTADRYDVPLRAGSYRASVQTQAGETTTHTLRWADFTPTSYGRPVSGAPPLQRAPERIAQLGWMIADGQPGDFALQVNAVRPLAAEASPDMAPATGPREGVLMAFAGAIRLGVPAFNMGDPGRCRAHYQSAIETVLLTSPDAFSESERQVLQASLMESMQQGDADAAWTLRRAMDSVMMGMTDPSIRQGDTAG
ncbi:MAG TPA: hypothetical protein DFR83_04525 [Deltaproteobacteria bacterium]|nr:hypothetical protein [Deltaproteobacteria bacterium]